MTDQENVNRYPLHLTVRVVRLGPDFMPNLARLSTTTIYLFAIIVTLWDFVPWLSGFAHLFIRTFLQSSQHNHPVSKTCEDVLAHLYTCTYY